MNTPMKIFLCPIVCKEIEGYMIVSNMEKPEYSRRYQDATNEKSDMVNSEQL